MYSPTISCGKHGEAPGQYLKEHTYMCSKCYLESLNSSQQLLRDRVLNSMERFKDCCEKINSSISNLQNLMYKDLSKLSGNDLNKLLLHLDDLPTHVKRLKDVFKNLKGIGNVVSLPRK